MTYRLISCICGGFLLAVLWFDLMHDVVVYPYLLGEEPVSADALMTIETYYQRVVIDSSPMNLLVGFVMVLGIVTNIIRLVKSQEPTWLRLTCLALFLPPTGWALLSIVPMAAQLASAGSDSVTQASLAIRIFYAHVICLGLISAFVSLQLTSWQRPCNHPSN